jgi:hypothetical protein
MIKKQKLRENVEKAKGDTKAALQLIYDSLNNGQQKKLLKNSEVKKLLVFYGVISDE